MFYDHINRYFIRRKNYSRLADKYRKEGEISLVMKGREVGFFSIFFQVLGAIDFCYKNRINLLIDFEKGPYFEESVGPNWWSYYFENNEFLFGSKGYRRMLVDDIWSQKVFSYYGRALSPKSAFPRLQEMQIKAKYWEKVESFFSENKGLKVCGIHYRGTDKVSGSGQEATKVPYEFVVDLVKGYGPENYFFIATDEQQFLDYVSAELPGRVLFRTAFRSLDNKPIHNGVDNYSMYKAGEEALIDCLILSQCSFLVRTDSNLSYACRFFNPRQKNVNITENYLR